MGGCIAEEMEFDPEKISEACDNEVKESEDEISLMNESTPSIIQVEATVRTNQDLIFEFEKDREIDGVVDRGQDS